MCSDRDSSIDVLDLSKRVDDTLDILSVFVKDGDCIPQHEWTWKSALCFCSRRCQKSIRLLGIKNSTLLIFAPYPTRHQHGADEAEKSIKASGSRPNFIISVSVQLKREHLWIRFPILIAAVAVWSSMVTITLVMVAKKHLSKFSFSK